MLISGRDNPKYLFLKLQPNNANTGNRCNIWWGVVVIVLTQPIITNPISIYSLLFILEAVVENIGVEPMTSSVEMNVLRQATINSPTYQDTNCNHHIGLLIFYVSFFYYNLFVIYVPFRLSSYQCGVNFTINYIIPTQLLLITPLLLLFLHHSIIPL